MAKPYILPPTIEQIFRSFAEHMALAYRVKISYTITHKNGNYETVELMNPDA